MRLVRSASLLVLLLALAGLRRLIRGRAVGWGLGSWGASRIRSVGSITCSRWSTVGLWAAQLGGARAVAGADRLRRGDAGRRHARLGRHRRHPRGSRDPGLGAAARAAGSRSRSGCRWRSASWWLASSRCATATPRRRAAGGRRCSWASPPGWPRRPQLLHGLGVAAGLAARDGRLLRWSGAVHRGRGLGPDPGRLDRRPPIPDRGRANANNFFTNLS